MSVPKCRAWMDKDGKHVWVEQPCGTHMLPYPTWHRNPKHPWRIEPSFTCEACGVHEFLDVGYAS